jgi:epoxide hydrolase
MLGYERYGVHGGDVGAGVSATVAGLDGDHVIGVHVVTDPLTAANTATFLPGMADRLDENDQVDKLILDRMEAFRKEGPATWRSRTAGRRPSATVWSTHRCCS